MKKNALRNQKGSVIIMVTIVLVVLVGMTALVIDGGARYLTKEKLQNAADAAALAGATKLPDATSANTTAINYGSKNGVSTTTPTTPYDGDNTKIQVVCQQYVPYTFAKIFGSSGSTITARAVAKSNNVWDGDALPFINVNQDYETDGDLIIWDKDFSGLFASVHDNDSEWIAASQYFKLNWQDGIIPKNGEVATIKQELQTMYNRLAGEKVYMFSLKSDIITDPDAMVEFTGGIELSKENINQVPNNGTTDYNIKPEQLVLLECTWTHYSSSAKELFLEYTGNSWDVYDDDLPIGYVGPPGLATSQLIE